MTFNGRDTKTPKSSKPIDQGKSLAMQRQLIDNLRNSLIKSQKAKGKDAEEIEFLLKRL